MRPYTLGNYQVDGLGAWSCPAGYQLSGGVCRRETQGLPIPAIWTPDPPKPSAGVVVMAEGSGGEVGVGPAVAILAAMGAVGLLAVLAMRSGGSRRPARLRRAWGW